MPVHAIRKNRERNAYTVDGATFYWRRLTLNEQREIDAVTTTNGQRNRDEVIWHVLLKGLVGWEGYIEPDTGLPILFEPDSEHFRDDVEAIPSEYLIPLAELIRSTVLKRDADLGNSVPGSTAATPLAPSSQADGFLSPASPVETRAETMTSLPLVT